MLTEKERTQLAEYWSIADQYAHGLAKTTAAEVGLLALDEALEDDPLERYELETHFETYTKNLLTHFGHLIVPVARLTLVSQQCNAKNRHYRSAEYRLYLNDYATIVAAFNPTEDGLDIDPNNPRQIFYITFDEPLRTAPNEAAAKAALKELLPFLKQAEIHALEQAHDYPYLTPSIWLATLQANTAHRKAA